GAGSLRQQADPDQRPNGPRAHRRPVHRDQRAEDRRDERVHQQPYRAEVSTNSSMASSSVSAASAISGCDRKYTPPAISRNGSTIAVMPSRMNSRAVTISHVPAQSVMASPFQPPPRPPIAAVRGHRDHTSARGRVPRGTPVFERER